jgi:hypothetical protein
MMLLVVNAFIVFLLLNGQYTITKKKRVTDGDDRESLFNFTAFMVHLYRRVVDDEIRLQIKFRYFIPAAILAAEHIELFQRCYIIKRYRINNNCYLKCCAPMSDLLIGYL